MGKVKFLPLGRWRGSLTQEDLPHQYVQLSDHLDFVGVELRATFQQTRKVNGEQLQERVKNTVGPWKAGRFMPLTLRPYSANTYALSKVWFKCSSVNLRNQDIDSITSQVKSWLYQDCLEKPSELVLYRHSLVGGLGLFHVKIRSLALLIRSFMETASNPNFRHNLLHEVLFRYHVLGEDSLPNPGFLPYYDESFFTTIKHYYEACPMNISTMTTKQWYRLLLEDRILMQTGAGGTSQELLPVQVELLHAGLSPQAMLKLDFGQELDETDQLATLVILATGLMYIWQARSDKKVVVQYKMKAEIEAVISILRKTRYCASADRMLEIIV